MNRTKLKNYAPQARRDFIAAVTDRAAYYGLTKNKIEPITEQGDVAIIGGRAFPRAVAAKRRRLEERIARQGFDQVMEAMAYTWFNRLVAIRFMELHGYLDHGYRVLSHPEGKAIPEIVEHAEHVDLPGLDKDKVIDLKLDGTKEAELYRLLLIAQCNALSTAMPFLFERVDDETELLLPDNLLHSDSLIRKLVNEIDEEDWQEVEIIGWLYQFYISEKKDQVIGKVVKSEDIPAATQLFTPNWIVKYLVQNTLGRQWLATYPQSPLREKMEYYIEPAEQSDEVKAQLAAITPSTLNPEELTLIDPASGSGHILVEAYDLFKAIYLERGYRQRDVAQLILEKNLFGLDIDERAAQLTSFALMMKGRANDRRLFERGVKLNVMALVDSAGFDAEGLSKSVELANYGLQAGDLTELKRLFEHATTFGSLIQVPERLAAKLQALKQLSEATSQNLFVSDALKRLGPLVQQAEMLATQYDAVVANPPYMGSKGMNTLVKKFAKDKFPDAKSDLFACFIERSYTLAKYTGRNAMVTMQSWMFLSAFQKMRERLIAEKTIFTMMQIGFNSFPSLNSKISLATAFSFENRSISGFAGTYRDLNSAAQSANKEEVFLACSPTTLFHMSADKLKSIPTSPLAYWASDNSLRAFEKFESLQDFAQPRQGLATTNNELFLRSWCECSRENLVLPQDVSDETRRIGKWFACNKGGSFRKWFGNNSWVVNYESEGKAICDYIDSTPGVTVKSNGRVINRDRYFQEGATWTSIGILFSMRHSPPGFVFETKGPMCFPQKKHEVKLIVALCNTVIASHFLKMVSPTLDFHEGPLGRIPICSPLPGSVLAIADRCVEIGTEDWDAYERSWDFQSLPILTTSGEPTPTLESSYSAWVAQNRDTIAEMKRLEEENNHLFIDAYGLGEDLTPDVPIEQITLTVNPAYRYGGKLTEEEQWTRFRQDSMEEVVSYAIGCTMGRYSLDEPGLIYAHSRNEGFDPSRYTTFPADTDGIVPLTDAEWFDDDAAHRLIKFISVAWDAGHLEENLTFLADNLSPKKNESSRETIRRYLSASFFKVHLQTYQNRPIYWLFSSGKQRAFQCLMYLHRYNDGTLSRMRTEYVIPLQGKIASRIEHLVGEIASATSTSHRRKQEKERDTLIKQQAELQTFDEKLRHYADQRISLDLDDGVKVNYGKFGDLLAEVKAVCGKEEE